MACNGEATNTVTAVGPGGPPVVVPTGRAVGVAELTMRNVTSTGISASILLATSVAQLEQLRQVPGSAGNFGSIQLQLLATGQFTDSVPGGAKTRFLRATFGVRNARSDSVLFDRARENLSFVALRTTATIANTSVRSFLRSDGSPASAAIASSVVPTVLSAVGGDGAVIPLDSTNLRNLSDTELKQIAVPAGASGLMPFAFVVRRAPTSGNASQLDGIVTFAFRFPEQGLQNDPSTISVLFVLVDTSSVSSTP